MGKVCADLPGEVTKITDDIAIISVNYFRKMSMY